MTVGDITAHGKTVSVGNTREVWTLVSSTTSKLSWQAEGIAPAASCAGIMARDRSTALREEILDCDES